MTSGLKMPCRVQNPRSTSEVVQSCLEDIDPDDLQVMPHALELVDFPLNKHPPAT